MFLIFDEYMKTGKEEQFKDQTKRTTAYSVEGNFLHLPVERRMFLLAIRKWRGVTFRDYVGHDWADCPFCKRYYVEHDCYGCPVKKRTKTQTCGSTPYELYNRAGDRRERKEEALKELHFIKALYRDWLGEMSIRAMRICPMDR